MSQKLKRITIAILSVLLLLSMASSLLFYNNGKNNVVNADTIDAPSIVAQEKYALNAKATFPSSVQVEYGGGLVDATGGIIIFPNGKTYNIEEGKEFTLSTVGNYIVKYYYDGNSGSATFQDGFVVSNTLYSLTDYSGSSITPTVIEDLKAQYAETGEKFQYTNIKSPVPSTLKDALVLRLKDGVKFTFEEPIDLTQKSEDGLSNIISFDPKLSECYYDDGKTIVDETGTKIIASNLAERFDIVLTDAYDPSISVTITCELKGSAYYFRANTQDTDSKALLVPSTWERINSVSTQTYYGSQRGIIWHNDYGHCPALYASGKGHTSGCALRMDYEKGILYAGTAQSNSVVHGSTAYQDVSKYAKSMFMDFNFSEINGGIPYKGFTTGEVYVSITISNYTGSSAARMDILSIGNQNALDIINRADAGYQDTKAPVIKSDFNATENDGVYVSVGEEFVVPSVEAYDVNLSGDVSTSVYRNYGLSTQTMVNVKDGKFTVAKEDVYYVVSTAKDYFGQTSQKIIKVFGVDTGTNTITLDTTQQLASQVEIGERILFPLGNKISTLNNYEDLKLKIELVSDKGSILVADLKNGAEIDEFWASENYFTIQNAGEYQVVYTYSDNAVSGSYSYEITAVANAVNVFESKPFIPRLLLKDASYEFDMVNILSYENGVPEVIGVSEELYIAFDGGSFVKIEDINDVVITGSQTAQLKAVYNGTEILSDVAIIKDVNYTQKAKLDLVNYFHTEDDFSCHSTKLLLTTEKKGGESAKLQFANIIDISNFYISYKIEEAYSRYNQINFVLTDPYNTENKVVFSLYTQSGTTYFTNGTQSIDITGNFVETTKKEISYNSNAKTVTFSGGPATGFVMDIPFTLPVAYLDIELLGIDGTAGVHIQKINNQTVNKTTNDTAGPVAIITPLVGTYAVGDVVSLPNVSFLDVLTIVDSDTVTTTFKYERKDVLSTIEGVAMDGTANKGDHLTVQKVKITKEGKYYFAFEAKDAFGTKGGSTNIIEVKDRTAPKIKFNGKIKEDVIVTLNVGQWIKLDYTLSDDVTPVDDLVTTIILFDVDSCIAYGDMTDLIFFEEESTYEVSIICIDKAANVTIKSFTVIAIKGEAN